MAQIHENNDDVTGPGGPGTALIRSADGTRYDHKNAVPFDLSGASGEMSVIYDHVNRECKVRGLTPLDLSDDATDAGRLLVGDGADIKDMACRVTLEGDGPPAASLGWDGAFYYDKIAKKVYGPRGRDTAGQWPTLSELEYLEFYRAVAGHGSIINATNAPVGAAPTDGLMLDINYNTNNVSQGDFAPASGLITTPSAGRYEIGGELNGVQGAAGDGLYIIRPVIAGAFLTAAQGPRQWMWGTHTGKYNILPFSTGPIDLAAGVTVGLNIMAQTNGDLNMAFGFGSFYCKRIA